MFLSLSSRDFRIYWIGMLFAFVGMQVGQVARQWLVYELTGSSTYLGIIGAATGMPMLFFGLVGGVVADRVVKRNLLIVTQAATGVLAFFVAFLITANWIQAWHVLVVAVLTGMIFSFNAPGRQAIVTELVPEDQLMNAVALNTAGMNLTRIIAPTVAGLLVVSIGLAGTYFVYALQYIIAIAFLLMLPAALAFRARMRSPVEDAREGLSYLRDNKIILVLMLLAVAPVIFTMPYMVLLPVVADNMGVGVQGMGLMMTASGAGALLGSLAVAYLGDFRHKGLLSLWAALLFGLALVLFAQAPTFSLALVALLFVGAGSTGFMAINNTLVLAITPEEMRGRIMGLYMVTWGLMPIGSLPAGILADFMGVSMVITLGGAILAGLAVATMVLAPSIRRL